VVLKKLLMPFAIIWLSFGVILQVSSFSLADVKSEMSIKITNSENALVGTPSFIDGGTIIQGSSKEININIRNNMSNVIDLVDIEGSDSGVDVKLQSTIRIYPGDAAEVPIIVQANSNVDEGGRLISLIYGSEWSGGSAVIEGNLSITVKKPVEIRSTVQNVIIDKDTFVETEIINKLDGLYKVVNIEFPKDKYITTDISHVKVQDNKIILPINITSMEPNLYEIPTVFTIDNDGCITRIETAIYINIEQEDNILEVQTEENTSEMSKEVKREISSNQETSNTDNKSENTKSTN
jgi:hypothetical protein